MYWYANELLWGELFSGASFFCEEFFNHSFTRVWQETKDEQAQHDQLEKTNVFSPEKYHSWTHSMVTCNIFGYATIAVCVQHTLEQILPSFEQSAKFLGQRPPLQASCSIFYLCIFT